MVSFDFMTYLGFPGYFSVSFISNMKANIDLIAREFKRQSFFESPKGRHNFGLHEGKKRQTCNFCSRVQKVDITSVCPRVKKGKRGSSLFESPKGRQGSVLQQRRKI